MQRWVHAIERNSFGHTDQGIACWRTVNKCIASNVTLGLSHFRCHCPRKMGSLALMAPQSRAAIPEQVDIYITASTQDLRR